MKRISITGPESSGKSTLSGQLAKHFIGGTVPEYARLYLEAGNKVLNESTILELAKNQIWHENNCSKSNQLIFCDTDILVLKMWSLEKFNRVPALLQALFKFHQYDYTLLCTPDLSWEYDPFRENPYDRNRLFEMYKKELESSGKPFEIVSGRDNFRLRKAIDILNPYLI